MLALRLPYEIETRLDELARRTGRSMSSFAREAIVEKLGELEAAHRPSRTFSLDELERLVLSRAPAALIRREGDRLIVEKPAVSGLSNWLKAIEPWGEDFPDVDADLAILDQPDFAEVEGKQFEPSGAMKALRITAKNRNHYGPSVIRRWEAGTVEDGRPTLFGKDIEGVSDSALFHVTREDNPKGKSSEARFDLILKRICRTVGEYRRMVGAKEANDDIAWDINHNFYCLMVPQ